MTGRRDRRHLACADAFEQRLGRSPRAAGDDLKRIDPAFVERYGRGDRDRDRERGPA